MLVTVREQARTESLGATDLVVCAVLKGTPRPVPGVLPAAWHERVRERRSSYLQPCTEFQRTNLKGTT